MTNSLRDLLEGVAAGAVTEEEAAPLLRELLTMAEQEQEQEPEEPKEYPLTRGQAALWAIHQNAPGTVSYNLPLALRLRPDVDLTLLERALDTVVRRYPSLRVNLRLDREGPVQVVAERGLTVTELDLTAVAEPELPDRVRQLVRTPFDLETEPLYRAYFLRTPAQPVLLLVFHHLITDGVSSHLLLRDILAAYDGLTASGAVPPAEPATPYREFVYWQRELLAGPEADRHREFWLRKLEGAASAPVVDAIADRRRTGPPSYAGESLQLDVDEATLTAVRTRAAELGLTPFSIVFGAFVLLLHRHSGQRDISVLVPTDGRAAHRFDRTVGYLINPVVLRTACPRGQTCRELFQGIHEELLAAEDHSAYPYAAVVDDLRRASRTDTEFTIGFYLQQGVGRDLDMAREQTLFTEALPLTQEGEGDLVVEFVVRDRQALIHFKYDPELFDPGTAARLAEQYRELVAGLTAVDPDAEPAAIDPHTPAERTLLERVNATDAGYPAGVTAADLVLDRAERTPDKTAIVDAESSVDYRELARRVELLAGWLRAEGHTPGSLIGISVDRRADLVVALLAVLRAGCAYVPLDPEFPEQRREFIRTDAGIGTVLTQSTLDRIDWAAPPHPLPDDRHGELAYVLYTSGSTGRPKGVQIGHDSLVNFLTSMAREPGCTERDHILALTTVGFDIAALELLLPLTRGGTVEIVPAWLARDGVALAGHLAASAATIVQATPATWRMLLAAGWDRPLAGKILCGGEALPAELAEQLLSRCAEVWNMYGPTETTIWSSISRVRPGAPVTVGTPIANTTFHLRDEHGHPVPFGAAGELWIGGDGLARGYLGRPELTAERFVTDPRSGARMFRTGDLGRFRQDGSVELLGRADRQVKLRGYRIEPGEVESALRRTGLVDEARVLLREDFAGHEGLVGFVTVTEPRPDLEALLRERLAEWLPGYMIPARLLPLAAFPQTPNAKIDLAPLRDRALDEIVGRFGIDLAPEPAPAPEPPDRTDSLGAGLRELVAEIAGAEPAELAVDTPLGDYGFDSIRFTRLSVGLRERFGIEVPPTTFYGYPTLRELTAHLVGKHGAARTTPAAPAPPAAAGYPPVAIIGVGGSLPDSDTLEEFWAHLAAGRDLIRPYPLQRGFSRSLFAEHAAGAPDAFPGAYLRDVEGFDAGLFRISPREAAQMDPQHRLLLQAAHQAMQDAGYPPAELSGSRTGVFVGLSGADYFSLLGYEREADDHFLIGNVASVAANRISYLFDFHGQSATYDTACSSSLVAIHRAARALQAGDCETALAGGANLLLSPYGFVGLQRAGMLSPDGRCKTFDERADGYGRGEGVALLLLKRLDRARADGDPVHGVLIGSAENHDGRTQSLTAPSPRAQSDVVVRAHEAAEVSPASIGYVEAHGTGTQLGDPIEVDGLKEAFGRLLDRWSLPPEAARIALGSVKSNIGHLEASAGVAGVLKVLLAMRHRTLPGLVHLAQPNPMIDLTGTPLEFQQKTTPWQPRRDGTAADWPRRAGVSSFGMGGSNVHVVLEEASAA
ncbi:non-ribosomal peptide synthetase [Amycolatopsis cihanbeyliensis]|uniref:Polyketide synthase PksJ n=1 Tax=Amycolatopsis cihanbeyliensis TaxID=1128664 RepID=A0A542DJD4_AMYCI|nr:non-ribosomal peptide synthetase [Amycolatopsis cihanbeyliensis]TQJ03211.1 polyketide synthase PksJ [Amycolatopsis cihanbeyliensis]WCB87228.1 EfrAIII [Amycolatopsis cihanbeyliensis]